MIAANINLQRTDDVITSLITGVFGKADYLIEFEKYSLVVICSMQTKKLHDFSPIFFCVLLTN